MLRTILRDIYFYGLRSGGAVRYFWWLLVLPGLSVAQNSQCTLYQAGKVPTWNTGPGPVEPSLAAAKADAQSLVMATSSIQANGFPSYGFDFECAPDTPPGYQLHTQLHDNYPKRTKCSRCYIRWCACNYGAVPAVGVLGRGALSCSRQCQRL
jgi:hypothetical protein